MWRDNGNWGRACPVQTELLHVFALAEAGPATPKHHVTCATTKDENPIIGVLSPRF